MLYNLHSAKQKEIIRKKGLLRTDYLSNSSRQAVSPEVVALMIIIDTCDIVRRNFDSLLFSPK